MILRERARKLVAPGSGILAADESIPTIGKRLAKHGIKNTEEKRRDYRELFLTAPGIENFLSGCILHKETLYQSATDGRSFIDILEQAGILAGIKVDEGLEPLEQCEGESHTKGLDKLEDSCHKYARQGATFSKWRAAFTVGASRRPSTEAININAKELASYARISQRCGLVPIVEPEVLIGGRHSIERSQGVAMAILRRVMEELKAQDVDLEACLLKLQMVMPGSEAEAVSPGHIAEATLATLSSCVPETVAGVVFLSGGQSEEEATVNLDLIVKYAKASGQDKWGLSFSFGRSLQASALELWSKNHALQEAQTMAAALARANALASEGKYQGPHPSRTTVKLQEDFRGWS